MNESQLRMLPAVLLAIAGVLVDATFRSDAYRDRIWAQIVLWLATSLQQVSEDNAGITMILSHGAFFLSVVSAGYQAYLVQCRFSALSDSFRADYTRFLAPSMVLPLLFSWFCLIPPLDDLKSAWIRCFVLYCLTLISLCGWRWTKLRRRRVRQDLIGMPTVESIPVFSSSRSLEERSWEDWSPSEVLTWIHSLQGDDWSSVCSQLAPERIPGSVLDTLTINELRSMGLPYGQASLLVDKISELTTQYPSMRQADRYTNKKQEEQEVDEWFNDNRPSPSSQMQQTLRSNASVEGRQAQTANLTAFPASAGHSTAFPASGEMIPGELNEETIQKAKDLFREQFGIELPEIKLRPAAVNGPSVSDEAGQYSEDVPPTTSTVPEPTGLSTVSIVTDGQVKNGFPEDLLDSMPPHVREVAEQRPDLVQMLWKQKQQGKSATSLGLSRIQQLRMQDPAYAERFVGAQAAAEVTGIPTARNGDPVSSIAVEEDEMPDQNSDGERTGLLRKRAARPPKYAAIR